MNLITKIHSFYEKSISRLKTDESVLRQSGLWMQSITWGLIGTTGFAITWLALAKTEEIVVAPGKLEPIGSVKTIKMPLSGIAKKILVKDGDRVVKGQTLIQLDAEASDENNKSLLEKYRLRQIQLKLKQVELDNYTSLNLDAIETLNTRIAYENEILNRFKSLAEIGASAELQYLQQRSTVQQIEGSMREAKLDGMRNKSILMQGIQLIKADIESIKSELSESNVTKRYLILKSPVDGIVFDLKPTGAGYSARATDNLMKIVPLNALEAKIEIESSDIGFVRVGMPVDLSIDSFPATDFGVLQGIVKRLGSDALPPDPSNRKNSYRFPASITLTSQSLDLKSGESLDLQPGMSLMANIKLRKVTYLQLLLGSFQNKVDSLRQI